ncbi:MAG: hypothetical protein WD578_01665 [Bacteroidales bacterium]
MIKFYTYIQFLTLFVINSYGQDQVWYYSGGFGITDDSSAANYMRTVEKRSDKVTRIITLQLTEEGWEEIRKEKIKRVGDGKLKIRSSGDKLFGERTFRHFELRSTGLFRFSDYRKNRLVNTGMASRIIPLHLEDTIKSYYPNNMPKSVAFYDQNRLVSNKNWLKNGQSYFDNLHYFVDKIPEHNMGQSHFRAYMINGIKESGIDLNQIADRVIIGWVVMENGETEGFHSISGMFSELNSTLIRLIKEMPGEWEPASINGQPVRYYMQIPFNFIDRTENFESLEISTGFVVWD